MKPIYVHLLVWNDRRYLPELFSSLDEQTYENLHVRVLDNGSTDGTREYIQQYRPTSLVARNVKNQGFAGGHNQLMKYTVDHMDDDDAYIAIINSDMIIDPDCFKKLAEYLDEHPDVQGVQPKLYRAFGEVIDNEAMDETMKSDIIDTTGLRLQRNWRMVDRGAGELDQGQYDLFDDIIAPTGTMAMYRASAVKALMADGQFFDGTFFAYREDCDLALRFKKRGFEARFVPEAKAWHYRGLYGAEKQSWFERLKNRRGQRPFFAALSTRNQLFVLLKHLGFVDAMLSAPWLIASEGFRVTYGFLFEKMTRKRLFEVLKYAPEMLRKRKQTKAEQVVEPRVIRAYVGR